MIFKMGEMQRHRREGSDFRVDEFSFNESPQEKFECRDFVHSLGKSFQDLGSNYKKQKYGISQKSRSDALSLEGSYEHLIDDGDSETHRHLLPLISRMIQNLDSKCEGCEAAFEAEHGQFDSLETKVRDLTCKYKHAMVDYYFMLDKILKSTEEALQGIRKADTEFRFLSQATAYGNFVYCISDIFSTFVALRYFASPRTVFILSTLTGTVSICGSLFAISYAKRCIEDISRHLTHDRYEFLNLEFLFRAGNSADEAVRRLFPHGIDEELLGRSVLKTFKSERSWKQNLYFLILYSNTKQDAELLKDAEFLMSVKLFVESTASHSWWNRMKIRRLMDSFRQRASVFSTQELVSCTEVFQNRAAVSFLPVTASLMFRSGHQDKIRVLLSGLGTTAAAFSVAESKEHEFDDLRRLEQKLKKEYRVLRRIWATINTEHD